MINVTQFLQHIFYPKQALLIYHPMDNTERTLVEAFDIAPDGSPINAHPLSHNESIALAKSLATSVELDNKFLRPKGLLPDRLLYSVMGAEGYAIWYTKAKRTNLLFSPSLGIPTGMASVPALLWKADKNSLKLYALKNPTGKKPTMSCQLYHAPFFNIYENGDVCMGNVKLNIESDCSLEQFIEKWETYFFGSYFSHMMAGHLPVNGNLVQLWENAVDSPNTFDETRLIKSKFHFKDLIS